MPGSDVEVPADDIGGGLTARESFDHDDADDQDSALSDQSEFISDNEDVFSSSSSSDAPQAAAQGVQQMAQEAAEFLEPASPPVLMAVNPGEGNSGTSDSGPEGSESDEGEPLPPWAGGANPPLDTGTVMLQQIRDILSGMSEHVNQVYQQEAEQRAREAPDRAQDKLNDAAYKASSLLTARANFWGGTVYGSTLATIAVIFAMMAYFKAKKNSSASPAPHTAGAATMPIGIETWVAQLSPARQQMVQGVWASWSQLGELEPFQRLSAFAGKHIDSLAMYEQISLLQIIRQVGSRRDQTFIWFESENLAYVKFLADKLTRFGYADMYANMAKARMNGRSLPVTVAAYCGQLAIALVYASRAPAKG